MSSTLLFKILCLLFLLALLVILSGDFYFKDKFRSYKNSSPTKPLIIAHRGASGEAPENTLAAIELALKQKADMIEVDVFLSKDEHIVVIHDASVNRTTNGQGKVETLTLTQLKKLDAGGWFGAAFVGEKIPTLTEVLTAVQGKAQLLIEVKQSGRGIARKINTLIAQHQANDWCIVQSFDTQVIKNLHKLKSPLRKHQLVVGNLPLFLPYHVNKKLSSGSVYQYANVQSVNLMYWFTTQRVIEKLHAQNQQVIVWTVNQPKDIRRLMNMGVDGIITNYPGKARQVCN
ncbi:glycerophosphodiester phosphodiesterase family protein [uncultured Microscilla sp.]|uniref:glycerophosphodiester phosphodiesterase n=1 Tax=uncultured Microscilla sp. TaxID=432653 RepID=UPI0026359D6E|nr:glycerophosphodiester phosphodiesterase family protein [uncultured Microscilla sp.]